MKLLSVYSSRDLAQPCSRFRQKRAGGVSACERSAERKVIICTFRRGLFEEKLLCRCSRMPSWSDWAQRLRVDQSANEYSPDPRAVLTNAVIGHQRFTLIISSSMKRLFVRLPASLVGHEPNMYALIAAPSFTRGEAIIHGRRFAARGRSVS